LRQEQDVLEKRLEALYLDKLDHVITPEFFSTKAKEWQDKLTDIKARLDRHGTAHVSYLNEGGNSSKSRNRCWSGTRSVRGPRNAGF
jgi:hypothetical protein